MAYKGGTPNGKLYLGHVKWSNDYKHVMLFSSESARNSFMTSHLTLKKENVIYYNPNKYIDVNGKLQSCEKYNYAYYVNDSDISSTEYCCFITDYEYIAPNVTRLYIELDVFQMFYYSTTFYQSYIERAIISKSDDNQNENYLPEPVSAPLEYEHKIQDISDADTDHETHSSRWEPIWVLHMASYYNSTTKEYQYDGIGTNNTYGEYGRFIESREELATVIERYGRKSPQDIASEVGQASGHTTWQSWLNAIFAGTAGQDAVEGLKVTTSVADLQDHRNELIGLYAIPKWLKDNFDGNTNFADNRRTSVDVNLSINSDSLANGYTPRNKKLLTSVCRAYVLANKTGMQKTFKPELFTGSPKITLSGITMSTGGYNWQITNYADIVNSYDEVAYNSERRVGYDQNTGLNKVINTIGAGGSALASLGGIAGGVASGNPVSAISGVGSASVSLVKAIDQIGQKEQHFGHNGDLLRITGGRAMLSWYEISPTVSECQSIDNFFDMYGYTIQKHANPLDYLLNKYTSGEHAGEYNYSSPTRSKWNYIKCADNVNMSCQCPAVYENQLKNIFSSGVTLWHTYDHFGDYSQSNS